MVLQYIVSALHCGMHFSTVCLLCTVHMSKCSRSSGFFAFEKQCRNSASSMLFWTQPLSHILWASCRFFISKIACPIKAHQLSNGIFFVIHTCCGVQAESLFSHQSRRRSRCPSHLQKLGLTVPGPLVSLVSSSVSYWFSHTDVYHTCFILQKILIDIHRTPLHSNSERLLWKNSPFNKTSEVHKTV